VVSKVLRHSDPKLTSEIYEHLEVEDMCRGLERLGFGPAQVPAPAAENLPAPPCPSSPSTAAEHQQVRSKCGRLGPQIRSPRPLRISPWNRGLRVGATGFEPAPRARPRAEQESVPWLGAGPGGRFDRSRFGQLAARRRLERVGPLARVPTLDEGPAKDLEAGEGARRVGAWLRAQLVSGRRCYFSESSR
jgi:hypothetical protein